MLSLEALFIIDNLYRKCTMKANLLLFASSGIGRSGDGGIFNDNDAIFNSWCEEIGIDSTECSWTWRI